MERSRKKEKGVMLHREREKNQKCRNVLFFLLADVKKVQRDVTKSVTNEIKVYRRKAVIRTFIFLTEKTGIK